MRAEERAQTGRAARPISPPVRGRVVRRDLATGLLEPVAGVRVHLESADCRFLGFYPAGHPWFWLYPLACRHEEVAVTATDGCGRFTVPAGLAMVRRLAASAAPGRPRRVAPAGPVPPPPAGQQPGVRVDPGRFAGPFLREPGVSPPTWSPVTGVPDLVFRVTRPVADGEDEVICPVGHFDVAWSVTDPPEVLLVAPPTATPVPGCAGPDLRCGTRPAIRTAGLVQLRRPYHDPRTGYALMVNQPRAGGSASGPRTPPATTPYCLTVALHGCHHRPGATRYRLLCARDGGPAAPLTGLDWWAPRLGGGPPFRLTSDPDGWLDLLPPDQLHLPHLLAVWQTWRHPDGRYSLSVQLGDRAGRPLAPRSRPVALRIDNSGVTAAINAIRWRPRGGRGWRSPEPTGPVINRAGRDIELRVDWEVRAAHLFHARVFGIGADEREIPRARAVRVAGHEHWHTGADDNSHTARALFDLHRDRPPGGYTFGVNAYSRAYHPGGPAPPAGRAPAIDAAFLAAYPRTSVVVAD